MTHRNTITKLTAIMIGSGAGSSMKVLRSCSLEVVLKIKILVCLIYVNWFEYNLKRMTHSSDISGDSVKV